MPTNIRLSKEEQEVLREKATKINKLLVNMDKAPLTDSELVHKILIKSIAYAEVTKEGEVVLPI